MLHAMSLIEFCAGFRLCNYRRISKILSVHMTSMKSYFSVHTGSGASHYPKIVRNSLELFT